MRLPYLGIVIIALVNSAAFSQITPTPIQARSVINICTASSNKSLATAIKKQIQGLIIVNVVIAANNYNKLIKNECQVGIVPSDTIELYTNKLLRIEQITTKVAVVINVDWMKYNPVIAKTLVAAARK